MVSQQSRNRHRFADRNSDSQVTAVSCDTIEDSVACLLKEFELREWRLVLGGSRAVVDPQATVQLLQGDVLILEDDAFQPNPEHEGDARYRLCETWVQDEMRYSEAVSSAVELYGTALGKLDILEHLNRQPYTTLFRAMGRLAKTCNQTALKLYCDALKLKMALKRRNMFYENKKQETTETGAPSAAT
ncbi:hypothetical protein AAG570_002382 [Ranatra chinensis]|uniref:CIDE-N domain-containing protein n=1 Tax=Ranatra chinensis TaxID=642074 RepID=A0ABD0Y7C4_9HEMI